MGNPNQLRLALNHQAAIIGAPIRLCRCPLRLALNHQAAIIFHAIASGGQVLRLALNHQAAIIQPFLKPWKQGFFFPSEVPGAPLSNLAHLRQLALQDQIESDR
jgi:hypothetical protein